MKKALVVLVVAFMLCISMSSIAVSEFAVFNSEEESISNNFNTINQNREMDPDALEHFQSAADSYLRMNENSFTSYEEPKEAEIDIPWIGVNGMQGDFVSWWVRLKYKDQEFAQELDISPEDLRDIFLEYPYHHEILFFDIDEDDANDVEVRVGFYWKRYFDPDGNDPRGLEFKFIVTQTSSGNPGGGIADPYAELEVWSEISLNVGLVRSFPINKPITYNVNSIGQRIRNIIERILSFREGARFTPLKNLLERVLSNSEQVAGNVMPLQDPQPLDADDDYLSMGAGYRSPQGSRIPQSVTKKFWFARESIFSPTLFQHEFDPDGSDPIELLYGFQAYKGGHTYPSFDIEFSVGFEPAVYLRTMFIPLKGYVRYYFLPKSKTYDTTTITFASNVLEGVGEGINLQLIFDEIDSSLAYSGRWFSFDFDIFDKFMYRASNKFSVALQVVTPWLSEKIKFKGIPTSIDFHRRDWTIEFNIVQGEVLELEVLVETKLIMDSKLDEFILYYPKADPVDPDVMLLNVVSIPSTETFSVYGHMDIVNSTYLTAQLDGYVDFTMSSQLGEVALYSPKEYKLFEVKDIPARERVGAEATLHYKRGDIMNENNYVYGRIYRDFSSNLGAINFYLPNVNNPVLSITDIPADAWAEGKLQWAVLTGYAEAVRQSQGAEDPIAFYLEFDQFTIDNVLEIGEGHIRTDFKIQKQDGYFELDTSAGILDNYFEVKNTETGGLLSVDSGTVAANDFKAQWDIDDSGDQLEIQELALTGALESLKNFEINIELAGKNSNFEGYWDVADKAGGFEIEFYQDEPVTLDFNLDQFEKLALYGYVTLAQNIHFDMDWDFKEGTEEDRGHFYINKNTNDPNLEAVNLVATFNDRFGVDILVEDIQLLVSIEWWKNGATYDWSAYWYVCTITYFKLLWNYNWYTLIQN